MAAPLGFKTFTVGEVLSAADVNGYLMQGVLVFATTAARDAAITSPQEGQFAFTKDTNSLFFYDGAAWVASGATGDIEGVTAGVGISGGGTSGTVTVTNSMATAIDAKGDLVVGTGADTFSRLAVGTNGQVLTADSSEATGLKFATPASGGGMTLLSTTTLSGATTTISTISGSYNNLQLIIYGANVSSAGGVLVIRPNAVTNLSSGAMLENNNGSAATGVFSNSGIEVGYNAGMINGNTDNIISVVFYNYANSTNYKSFTAEYGYAKQTSGIFTGQLGGAFRSNTAISSIEIVASGTFSAGTALLYGVK